MGNASAKLTYLLGSPPTTATNSISTQVSILSTKRKANPIDMIGVK